MNICVQSFVWTPVSSSLGYTHLGVESLCHMIIPCWTYYREMQSIHFYWVTALWWILDSLKWLNGEFYVMWILPQFLKTIKRGGGWSHPQAVGFRPMQQTVSPSGSKKTLDLSLGLQCPEQALYIHTLHQLCMTPVWQAGGAAGLQQGSLLCSWSMPSSGSAGDKLAITWVS